MLSASSAVLTPTIVSKMNLLRGLDITYDVAHYYCGASLGNLAINNSSLVDRARELPPPARRAAVAHAAGT